LNTLNNIFNEPIEIDGVSEDNPIKIYPIILSDYEKFQELSKILYISKNHFPDTDFPLLGLIFQLRESLQMSYENLIATFEKLFSMVTKEDVKFVSNNKIEGFVLINKQNEIDRLDIFFEKLLLLLEKIEKKITCNKEIKNEKHNSECKENDLSNFNIITINNYDLIREVVMKQNLMFEEKVYKNEKVREWAKKTLEAKSKNQPKIGIEEVITTVSTLTGKHYSDLKKYSIYQIYSDFYRIRKGKAYDISITARCQGADIEVEDFAEDLDIYKNPYDGLFVDSNKLNKIN